MPDSTHDLAAAELTNLPARICDVITPWAEGSPERPALVETSGTWTYRQLASAVSDTERWLLDLGVRPGDRVMIVCENCRAFVAILLACAAIDAWPVLVNSRLSAREVDEIRDHCGARRVIYTTTVSAQAREHAKRHGAVIQEAPGLGPIAVGPLNEQVEPEPIDSEPGQRIAALIYTSGTTGLPKGVMLTHRNLLFVAAVSAKIRSLTPEDRLYGVLPMSHAVGLSVVLLGALLSGATLYLSPRFDPVAALAAMEKEHLTVVLGAPSMFSLLADYSKMKGVRSLKFPALRIISSSGAPLLPPLKAQVESLFGMTLVQRIWHHRVLSQYCPGSRGRAPHRYIRRQDSSWSRGAAGWTRSEAGGRRRSRRIVGPRSQCDEGVLSRARRNGGRDQSRRLVQLP